MEKWILKLEYKSLLESFGSVRAKTPPFCVIKAQTKLKSPSQPSKAVLGIFSSIMWG